MMLLLYGCGWREAQSPQQANGAAAVQPIAPPNPGLIDLPRDQWVKIHEQSRGDAVRFSRQAHGGSAFDARRGRLILFGSDTHGEDWSNSPLFFDMDTLAWTRLYADDPPETYRVNGEGIPVAGANGDHPWAMHTFGAVEYDSWRDALIVSSYPQHLEPGRFTDAMSRQWPRIRRHPTWLLDLETGSWRALATEAVHFFPYATAFDSDRGVVIGYRSDGVYELAGDPPSWTRFEDDGFLGYPNNAVYDSWRDALVVFGSNETRNDVVVYEPATGRHRIMPTPGQRPPRGAYAPMAFHARTGLTVVVVDNPPNDVPVSDARPVQAETWLYDLSEDAWTRLPTATLPFGVGMNYNMEYDPGNDLLVLVTESPGGPTAVWGLRLSGHRLAG